MPWIELKQPWSHVESAARTVEYQPGKHNVTADIASAFEARNKQDADADNPNPQGRAAGIEGGERGDGAGAGEGNLS